MEDEPSYRFYATYIILFLLSLLLAALSALLGSYNPVGWLLLSLTSPLVPLSGGEFSAVSSSGASVSRLIVNCLWPISLVPLQLVSMQGLKWRAWQFLLLWFGFNLLLAFAAQRVNLGL